MLQHIADCPGALQGPQRAWIVPHLDNPDLLLLLLLLLLMLLLLLHVPFVLNAVQWRSASPLKTCRKSVRSLAWATDETVYYYCSPCAERWAAEVALNDTRAHVQRPTAVGRRSKTAAAR